MAFITDTRIVAGAPSVLTRLKTAFAAYFDAVIAARGRRAQIDQLNAMSDRQLADIGIDRKDIAAVVFRDKMHM